MTHGNKATFEIVGEQQVIDGVVKEPPSVGFRFGRMLHEGSPFRPTEASLNQLGAVMTAVEERPDGPIPAGFTYFGQFIDHDLTKDSTSNRPENAPEIDDNLDKLKQDRSPTLDLDSLYGKPGGADVALMQSDGKRMALGTTTSAQGVPAMANMDVPRVNGVATIGDPRNDENLIVQQLHVAFLKFHNKTVDALEGDDPTQSAAAIFASARDLVTRHYQWVILEDFVRRIIHPDTFRSVFAVSSLAGADTVTLNPIIFKVSAAQIPPMPLEFSGAAYRIGHSMVRDDYGWNRLFGPGTGFNLFFIFTQLMGSVGSPGLETFPSNWIADWRRMFDFSGVKGLPKINRTQVPLNMAKRLDIQIAAALGNLPKGNGNLAARNLIRGSKYGLRSGQETADLIRSKGDNSAVTLTPNEILAGLDSASHNTVLAFDFHLKTPLWFYILKEAQNIGGETLGPVGSRIVAESFLAFARTSKTSIFTAKNDTEHTVFNPAKSPLRTVQGNEPLNSLAHILAFVDEVNPLGD